MRVAEVEATGLLSELGGCSSKGCGVATLQVAARAKVVGLREVDWEHLAS